MEIERRGANCVVIGYKKSSLVIDPKLSQYGLKDQIKGATAVLLTQPQFGADSTEDQVIISGPGEYEVNNCSIIGIAAARHSGEPVAGSATIYRFETDECSVAVLGHINPNLSDDQLEAIGVVDVLIIPVGGFGYTLEPKEAVDLVRAIEPKIVIPTHYAEPGVKYEVPQAPLEDFIKELGTTTSEATPKLKLKAGTLPETLTVFELTRTS